MKPNSQRRRYPEILHTRVPGAVVSLSGGDVLVPPPREIWVTVALDDNFVAIVTVASQEGRPVIERVEVGIRSAGPERDGHVKSDASTVVGIPQLPPGGLPASAYHALRFSEVLKVAKQVLDQLEETALRERGYVRELLDGAGPRGRKGWPDSFHARIAKHYVDALDRGSRRPVEQVARILDMKPSQVRDALHAARNPRGREPLLSPTGQGRAGGGLTEKALEILAATSGN